MDCVCVVRSENRTRKIGVVSGETILDALIKNNVRTKYSCGSGICTLCKVELISGEVEYTRKKVNLEKIKENEVLICCAKVSSDITIQLG